MTITQTVEIPDDRRIILEVPPQIPSGKIIIAFTPVTDVQNNRTENRIHLTKSMMDEIFADETIRSLSGILKTEMSLEEIREERLEKYLK